jgi:hypothetical protein
LRNPVGLGIPTLGDLDPKYVVVSWGDVEKYAESGSSSQIQIHAVGVDMGLPPSYQMWPMIVWGREMCHEAALPAFKYVFLPGTLHSLF